MLSLCNKSFPLLATHQANKTQQLLHRQTDHKQKVRQEGILYNLGIAGRTNPCIQTTKGKKLEGFVHLRVATTWTIWGLRFRKGKPKISFLAHLFCLLEQLARVEITSAPIRGSNAWNRGRRIFPELEDWGWRGGFAR